jgi:polyisoprenoid-binding protein YceI
MKDMGAMRRRTEATATSNRQDFGISADPGMIGDRIQIRLDIEMVRK